MDRIFWKMVVVFALLGALVVSGCASGRLSDEEILYTPIGASDVIGLGAIPLTDGYVYLIEEELEARRKAVELLPLAIPGETTRRLNEVVQVFLLTRPKPALVTLWLGANDLIRGVSPGEYEKELQRIVASLREHTDAFLVMGNIPDLTRVPRFIENPEPTVTDRRIRQYNAVIAGIAKTHEVPVVDFFVAPIEEDLVSDIDGFHPNNEGHRRIAEMFLEVILKEL